LPTRSIRAARCSVTSATAGNFVDGAITAHPDSVIPAIVDRFAQLGTPVTGRFLSGNTGAFWRGDSGIPVLSSSALLRLITSI